MPEIKTPLYLKIAVATDSKRESVKRQAGGRLAMNVREPAERNLANKRVIEIVRTMYPGQPVHMVHGHHSSRKTVLVGRKG